MRQPNAPALINLVALGLLVGLVTEAREVRAQTLNSASGQAYGSFVGIAGIAAPRSPLAVLPQGGGIADGQVLSVSVPAMLMAEALTVVATGSQAENAATAQSSATAENVTILNGLVRARLVVAMASSASNGTKASSNGEGSTLVDFIVNGVPMGTVTPAPNTRIDIPGVASVIVNEQMSRGDGIRTSGLTVNMIHVLVGGLTPGDIIVGSAQSDVAFSR